MYACVCLTSVADISLKMKVFGSESLSGIVTACRAERATASGLTCCQCTIPCFCVSYKGLKYLRTTDNAGKNAEASHLRHGALLR
jgi:hypothetical protein